MTRYTVFSKTLDLRRVEEELSKVGARDVRSARLLGEAFANLDPEQVRALSRVPGLHVKEVKRIVADQVTVMPHVSQAVLGPATLTPPPPFDLFNQLRDIFVPSLTGAGLTAAILDSGIRETHQSLAGKVVYEANFTDAPGVEDVIGHGTQVAFVAAGGAHGGERAGVSPGAKLMNVKVIGDDGVGTDETIIMGIDEVCELVEAARQNGLHPTDDLYPNLLNLSLGAPDTGDPDEPLRLACRQASVDYGLDVIAAAGNTGPKPTTVLIPAAEPQVIAVGGLMTSELVIWEHSSRGPTLLGDTKPDFVFWATDLETASHLRDDGYVVKSGTSFATPMLSGLGGLFGEAFHRAYHHDYLFRWAAFREFAPFFCLKPEDAAMRQDNDYGYGLPAMGMVLEQIAGVTTPEHEMVEAMAGMVMMMAVVGITRGIME